MKKLTPLQAIRQNCLECSGNSASEVKLCTRSECPLYPFRLGKHPCRQGMGSVGNFKTKNAQATQPLTVRDEAKNAHSTAEKNTPNEY